MIAEEGALSSLEARLAVQREKLAQLKEQYRSINEDTLILANLERKRAALEGSYKKFSENLQQARIDQSLKLEKISNITIAQQPTYSLQPLKTKKLVVLLGGVFGGILAAVALAFFLESFDHTIRKPDDIQERLNMRCLVSLPEFETPQRMIPDMHELPNLTIIPERKKSKSSTTPAQFSNTPVIKYFDALMQRLIFSDKEQPGLPYIIAVTSARSGEGVSTVAANLAMRLARLGHGRVLLADMNPMNLDHAEAKEPGCFPALGNMIALQGARDAAGLPAVLLDRLFLMQYSGQNRTETALGEMQSVWGKDYEFVVMDVPPVLNNEGASMVARLAHKVILVVQAERERWQVIRRAQELLEEAHANVIGAILNKRTMYIPEWVYRRL
jgi:succinoglycan biosynthesis transport protein ExoP